MGNRCDRRFPERVVGAKFNAVMLAEVMDGSPQLALGAGYQVKGAGKAGQDRKQRAQFQPIHQQTNVFKVHFGHSTIGALRTEPLCLERTRRDYGAIKLRWILIKCPSIRRPSQRQENVLRVDFVLLAKCSTSSDASGVGGAAGEEQPSFRSSEPTNLGSMCRAWPVAEAPRWKRDRGKTPAPSTAITTPIVNS